MIIVDGEKYACIRCIRGHRSSTCKHAERPLMKVRSRGRPSPSCNHRIAILNEKKVATTEVKESCCNGEGHTKVEDSPDPPSCCATTNGTASSSSENKVRNCCSGNGKNAVIILTATDKKVIQNTDDQLQLLEPEKRARINRRPSPAIKTEKVYEGYLADGCSVPGSCACDPESCNCPSCEVHNVNSTKNHVQPFGPVKLESIGTIFSDKDITYQPEQQQVLSNNITIEDLNECCCPDDNCHCFNCAKHGNINGYHNGLRISDFEDEMFRLSSEHESTIDKFLQDLRKSFDSNCICASSPCTCKSLPL
ncbi:BA75_03586T0 [Komagataella pastoris]|uniref:BA75_03586T0 n=1 Tax=Komagataella pastoris TaxID=4922 RepID=A0A1B2JGK6_PICPA|nr:BA75_03586T0 [Komagataella pastoris]